MTPASTQRTRVLVVTGDVLGVKMAGPAIRAWEITKVLHEVCDVRLVSTQGATLSVPGFDVRYVDEMQLKRDVDWCDVLVFQGSTLTAYPWIARTDTVIVADVYDPMHLEILEQAKDVSPALRETQSAFVTEMMNVQLELADFLLCASEKQRDLWLGQLAAASRINPQTYDQDPSLRSLIDIAPFGISESIPEQTRHAIKGVVPGIGASDQVIIWGGGIYNWFDPLTLIRAVHLLAKRYPTLRLYFLGVKHPNPQIPAMRMATQTMELSEELGLTGTHVFFNTDWVDYDDRVNYLLDADLGVSTHFEHIETAFSFRTRILDYLWTGLPIVATDGDTFAPLIREHRLGEVVPPEDVDALATAIERVLYGEDRDVTSARVMAFGEQYRWSKTLQPLLEFCKAPYRAADREHRRSPFRRQARKARARIRYSRLWPYTLPLRVLRRVAARLRAVIAR